MKYKVKSNLKRNGHFYQAGDIVEIDKKKEAKEIGADIIEPVKETKSPKKEEVKDSKKEIEGSKKAENQETEQKKVENQEEGGKKQEKEKEE